MKSGEEIESLVRRFERAQRELVDLLAYVKRTREALGRSSDEISSATQALSSIGDTTEKAAHNLLALVEKAMGCDEQAFEHLDFLEKQKEAQGVPEAAEAVMAAQDERTNIFTEMMMELSFQDLTCQTLEKVMRGLNELEMRILHLLDPESAPPPDDGEHVHAGSMSGLSRLVETQAGDSRQEMVDDLISNLFD